MAPVPGKNPPTFARVTVRGILNLNAPVGYPARNLKIVTADGQTVVLDLGMLKVAALNGQLVEVTGEIAGFQNVLTMCMPGQQELPLVRVQKLIQAS